MADQDQRAAKREAARQEREAAEAEAQATAEREEAERKAAEGASAAPPAEEGPARYSVDQLAEGTRVFFPDLDPRPSPIELRGALAGKEGSDFSVQDAEQAVQDFRTIETSPDDGAPGADEPAEEVPA